MDTKYLIVIEGDDTGYGAMIPDLPGCYIMGQTREELMERVPGAIRFHIESLILEGMEVPTPTWSESELVTVDIATACANAATEKVAA